MNAVFVSLANDFLEPAVLLQLRHIQQGQQRLRVAVEMTAPDSVLVAWVPFLARVYPETRLHAELHEHAQDL